MGCSSSKTNMPAEPNEMGIKLAVPWLECEPCAKQETTSIGSALTPLDIGTTEERANLPEQTPWELTVCEERIVVKSVDLLGQGAFSEVYRGVDGSVTVAVKFPIRRSAESHRRLQSEFAMFKRLEQTSPEASSHGSTALLPGRHLFVQMLACSAAGSPTSDTVGYIVLELAHATLADVILKWSDRGQGAFEAAQCLALLQHISRALRLLHTELEMVHGDVKPQNIAWFPAGQETSGWKETAGRWKLIDIDGVLPADKSLDLSKPEVHFFTAPYCAPELAAAIVEGVAYRAHPAYDSYSLGRVAEEMLLLHNPLYLKWRGFCEADDEGGEDAFFQWHAGAASRVDPPPSPPSSGGATGAQVMLQQVVRGLLHTDPEKRLSCATLASDDALAAVSACAYHDAATGLMLGMSPPCAVPAFELARTVSAVLAQALQSLGLPTVEALSAAFSLPEGESVSAICERLVRHEVQRHEAAMASGEAEPALSAFRFYQLLFPVGEGLSGGKRALAASKAWKAAEAGGMHRRWCELLEVTDGERFLREQPSA